MRKEVSLLAVSHESHDVPHFVTSGVLSYWTVWALLSIFWCRPSFSHSVKSLSWHSKTDFTPKQRKFVAVASDRRAGGRSEAASCHWHCDKSQATVVFRIQGGWQMDENQQIESSKEGKKGRKKKNHIWLCLINKVALNNPCQYDFCIIASCWHLLISQRINLKLKIHLHANLFELLALWLVHGPARIGPFTCFM